MSSEPIQFIMKKQKFSKIHAGQYKPKRGLVPDKVLPSERKGLKNDQDDNFHDN